MSAQQHGSNSQKQNQPSQKAPQLKQDFRETQPDRELEANKKKDLKNTQIASKRELDALQAQKPKAEVTQKLTPGGKLEYDSNNQVEAARQAKIAQIKRKLNTASQDMRKRFSRSR